MLNSQAAVENAYECALAVFYPVFSTTIDRAIVYVLDSWVTPDPRLRNENIMMVKDQQFSALQEKT